MNINRHNYEEYFILYLDNELGADERREVEAFVQLHPDLKEELDFLMQSKFIPDEKIVFEDKEELLFGQEPGPINLSNYEEWFVLYIDNELKTEQKIILEKFLAQHPELNEELALYERTKLPVEPISFPDKASLYRREEKTRRILIWRLAAAAILLVAAAYTTINLLNNKGAEINGAAEIADTNPPQTVPSANPVTGNPNTGNAEQPVSPVEEPAQANAATIGDKQKENNGQHSRKTEQVQPVEAPLTTTVKKQPPNELPDEPHDIMASIDHASNLTSPVTSPSKNDLTYSTETASITPVTKDIVQAYYPTQPIDEMENDGKKSKLRGLLRKVTRTFEKRTNIDATDDDDRLLVGGLAIRL
ncbi:MAG TPA: hypothetical protein VFX58_13790 [Chitinophagaceae bacterium]|nr:hypothetical protein [Chitinophagaceae bacterium]